MSNYYIDYRKIVLMGVMSMRVQVFGPIHKGLRYILHTRVLQLGQLDVREVEKTRLQQDEVKRAFEVLHVHAAVEEELVFPHLEEHKPKLFDRLHSEHRTFTQIMDGLEQQLEALNT